MKIDELHEKLPAKIAVEITDAVQFFLRTNADQQMRFVVHLAQHINLDVLQKAARLTIYQEPIFSYTYKESGNTAFWQKQPVIDSSLLVDLIETTDSEEVGLNQFLIRTISPYDFPIVKIGIIRSGSKDVLCINMNHTPTDGTGLKEFAGLLSDNYNKLIENPEFIPQANLQGDRSIKQITRNFSFRQKMKFIKEGFKRPPIRPSWSFDWQKSETGNQNQFAFLKISGETFDRIKATGKRLNATVNDVVIAAFVRSFVKTKQNNDRAAKPLIIPVNLRKYMNPGHRSAACSLTGSMVATIGYEMGDTFECTLLKTVKETAYKKGIHAEMPLLYSYLVAGKLMPYPKLKEKAMQRKMPPVPLLTNIGIIGENEINFNNIPIEDAYLTGIVSFGNFFTMGYSTFNNVMTFSIGFCGNQIQEQKVNKFLADFKSELDTIP
jgi:NRPS condensation-like uncharacterized protein